MSVYAALLRRPGAKALALACLSGWLSFASLGLAVVLLVHQRTGSYATAGVAVAMFSLAAGALAPVRGRIIDRRGASWLVAFGLAFTAALIVLLLAPTALSIPAAALAGLVAPPLIATARAVWPQIAGPELTRPSHAFNALLGDIGSVIGPALTGVLAAAFSPQVALAAVTAGPLVGSLIVAREQKGSDPVRSRVPTVALRGGLATVVAADVWVQMALGSLDVTAPVLGGPSGAIVLVVFAVGSVCASMWAGRSRIEPNRRFVGGTAGLAGTLAFCALAHSVAALVPIVIFAGAAYGVINVALFELLDVVVPSHRAVQAMTWITSAGGLGAAIGAALAGHLGADAVYLVAVAAVPGAAIAAGRRRTLTGAPPAVAPRGPAPGR